MCSVLCAFFILILGSPGIWPDFRRRVGPRGYGVIALMQQPSRMGGEAQGRMCVICRTTLDLKFAVDHCRETGRVHELLCSKCNYRAWAVRGMPRAVARGN